MDDDVDGVTGQVTGHDDYRAELTGPSPTLTFDQVHVHVTGDTAVVTGRNTRDGRVFRRYVDTYRRIDGRWACVHGCLWPVPTEG
jgi:ketosteroid isomerase-like protein